MKAAKAQLFSEINITPLTDIFLVLLIIMMVVAPMMQQSRADISPPGVTSGSAVKQGLLTVEVTSKGEFFVNGDPATEATLAQTLLAKKSKNDDAKSATTDKNSGTVLIRADKATRSGAVLAVLTAAKEAQFEKVTVAGETLSQARQQTLSPTDSTLQTSQPMEQTP
jgi:biopolymer transport protein ExbD